MKKVVKRVAAVVMAAVMVAGAVTGCGGNGGRGASKNGKTIEIHAQTNGLGQAWLNNAAKAYEAETGTTVNVLFDAYLSANLTTTLENQSLEVADLYFVQTYEWGQWTYNGYIADLTEFMNEKGEDGKSLNERMTSTMRYVVEDDGTQKQSIVPLTKAPTGLAYNKDMMNYLCHDVLGWEEGHDYPVNTKELYEVIGAMEKVTSDGSKDEMFTYKQSGQTLDVKPFVWSGSTGMLEFLTFAWLYQYLGIEGMTAFYNQYENCDMYNDEAFYQVYQAVVDLLKLEEDTNGDYISTTSIPNCVSYNHTASQQQLLLGKALMCPTGSWFYSEMKETITDADAWGFMPVPYLSDEAGNPITAEGVEMPKNEDGSYASYTYLNVPDYFAIPARSENQEDAKDFLRFIFSEEYMPTLQTDLQAPLCFEFDDAKVEKTAWFNEVANLVDCSTTADVYTGNIMQIYGKIGYYYNPDTAPFSRLSQSGFGSSNKLIDSATGKQISSASEATGVAVTENVYKYVQGNYKTALVKWNEAVRLVEGR